MKVVLEYSVVQSVPDFGLTLEFFSHWLELPIAEYVVGSTEDAAKMLGQPVLGLVRVDHPGNLPRFVLYLLKDALQMEMEDEDKIEVAGRMFRIEWNDDGEAPIRSCYPVDHELIKDHLESNPQNLDWWFLLKREVTADHNEIYRLCYLFIEPGPNGSFGDVEGYMVATKTDCASNNYFHKLRCRLFKKT